MKPTEYQSDRWRYGGRPKQTRTFQFNDSLAAPVLEYLTTHHAKLPWRLSLWEGGWEIEASVETGCCAWGFVKGWTKAKETP